MASIKEDREKRPNPKATTSSATYCPTGLYNHTQEEQGQGFLNKTPAKVTSGSEATRSDGSASESSWDARDEATDPHGIFVARTRTCNDTCTEGEATQAGAHCSSTASESSYSGRVPKLPVSAPGRAVIPGPATNLNIGMDFWIAPHVRSVSMNNGPNSVSIAPALVEHEGIMPEQQMIQLEEREQKRQRRKQSNRESARRSRMRKQQECEDLTRKVQELTEEGNALRMELNMFEKDNNVLKSENASMTERLMLRRGERAG